MKAPFFCLLMMSTVVAEPAELPLIVGHRGASHDAPENTLASFRLALQRGADSIEGDFRLTKDGHIVCIHDKDGRRTLGKDKAVIADSTLGELRQFNAGEWKGKAWQGEKVPTLIEVFDLLPKERILFLEVKCGPEIVPYLEKLFRDRGMPAAQVTLISYDKEVIRRYKTALPDFPAFWITKFKRQLGVTGKLNPSAEEIIATLQDIGADGLDCNADPRLGPEFAEKLRAASFSFHVWTVNDVQTARKFIGLGVNSITTDRPGWLREQLQNQ